MVSACVFTAIFEFPHSPLRAAVPNADLRRWIEGVAMGLTAIGLIYSPWGRRSGAHMNPSVTLAFLRLGRVAPRDAAGYVVAQFAGGTLGVLLSAGVLGPWLSNRTVDYVVTVPGPWGIAAAFVTELGMSFGLMTLVLNANASPRTTKLTGVLAGVAVAVFIGALGPLSGMSINPARTFASAAFARLWTACWLYFVAPPAGMLVAAEIFRRTHATPEAGCAKVHHAEGVRCIFCEHRAAPARSTATTAPGAGGVPAPTWIPSSHAD